MIQIQALALFSARVVDAMVRAASIVRRTSSALTGASDPSAGRCDTTGGVSCAVNAGVRTSIYCRLDGRRSAGDAAARRPNASSSATNSVINRSYHSQVDDVPTGSAGEAHAHVRREALRDGIGKPRTAHDALNGMDYFEMAQVLKAIALAIANTKSKERGIVGQALTHARSPINTFLAWSVGQIPQPVHDVRVQSSRDTLERATVNFALRSHAQPDSHAPTAGASPTRRAGARAH